MSPTKNSFRSGLRLELPYLVDALARGHGFLHNAAQFQFLAEIIADHRRHDMEPPASFLVAGCDQGIDAYSMCITLLEEERRCAGLTFSILSTDFLPANLDRAIAGIYPAEAVSNVPTQLTKRYFLRSRNANSGLVRLIPGVRSRIQFRCQDIFESFALREPMDVILCRQVLHHLNPDLATAMARHLRRYLAPGGLLILGRPLPRVPGLRHLQQAIYQAV